MAKRNALVVLTFVLLLQGSWVAIPESAAVATSAKTSIRDSKIPVTTTHVPTMKRKVRSPEASRSFAKRHMFTRYHWGMRNYKCLVTLWTRESNWNYRSDNPNSSAYGIPQALPGSKMASEGSDWRTNPETQIKWGLRYIKSRYGTPCAALEHSYDYGWY